MFVFDLSNKFYALVIFKAVQKLGLKVPTLCKKVMDIICTTA